MLPYTNKNERKTDIEYQALYQKHKRVFGDTRSLLARDSLDKISRDLTRLDRELNKNPKIEELRKKIMAQKEHFCFLMKASEEELENK